MNSKLPGLIAGRYQCVEVVGRGGMGTVYKAVQRTLERTVAVKMLSEDLASDEEFRARFEQEATVVALFNHPNIVTIYDFEPHNHTICIIMEFVDGESLQTMVERAGPLPPEKAASLCAQVARALDYAHDKGVVHRDIKPDNILVTKAGVAKITDFGIARFMESKLKTQTGVSMGTPKFMSPEQVTGKNVDSQSDLYSLGVCLYFALTGQTPFDGENPISIATKHLYEDPVRPTVINPAIPAGLERVVMTALQKPKQDRYATGAEMADALEEWAGTKSGSASATPPPLPTDPTRRMPMPSHPGTPAFGPLSPTPQQTGGATGSRMSDTGGSGSGPVPRTPTPPPARAPIVARDRFETGTMETAQSVGARAGDFLRHWWPALAAAGIIALVIALAFASRRRGPDGDVAAGVVVTPATEYSEVAARVGALRAEGKTYQALTALLSFQEKYPSFRSDSVTTDVDLLTAQLPPGQTDSELLLAARREKKGEDYSKEKSRLPLAHAYLMAAKEKYMVLKGGYDRAEFLNLVERNIEQMGSTTAPAEMKKSNELLASARQALASGDPGATWTAETRLVEAIQKAPGNFKCWNELADLYLQEGYVDDARVLYNYTAQKAPTGSEPRVKASQAHRALDPAASQKPK